MELRRRHLCPLPLSLLALLAPAAALSMIAACSAPPTSQPANETLAGAAQRAATALRPAEAGASRHLELALLEARRATAEDRASAPLLWHEVARAAVEARQESRRRSQELEQRWLAARAAASGGLARTGGHVSRLGRGRGATAEALARADLAAAERLAASGQLVDAIALAERSRLSSLDLDSDHQRLMARFEDPANRQLWRQWVAETVAESRRRRSNAIVVDKLRATLRVYRSGNLLASYPVELGSRGLERKLQAGDHATPEGRYRVTEVKTGPQTIYYKALLIDYPNAEDRRRYEAARRAGLAGNRGAGSLIEIHGDGGLGRNWTQGCVALSNSDLDTLWPTVQRGMAVTIVGTIP